MSWTLSEAKAKFSKVVDQAIKEGPQEITVATKEPVILVRKSTFTKLQPGSMKDFLDNIPKNDALAEVWKELEAEI